jgi:hypothetical protein
MGEGSKGGAEIHAAATANDQERDSEKGYFR